MHEFDIKSFEIIGRLIGAIIVGSVIGFEREYKSRPAGMKTHIMVCVGATVIALLQDEMMWNAIEFAKEYPKLQGVLSTEESSMAASVISGIGFLGAGTIMMTNKTVKGLTTAASIWAVAGVGLSIGLGYYFVAVCGFIAMLLALTLITYLTPLPDVHRIQIDMQDWETTSKSVEAYLTKRNFSIEEINCQVKREDESRVRKYSAMYTLLFPKNASANKLILELSDNKDIDLIKLIE